MPGRAVSESIARGEVDLKSQVQIKFVSKNERYKVPPTSFLVPTHLSRNGLSELVNGMLQLADAVPFDFLIDNQLLRVSLQEYLDSRVLSTENVLELEFFESTLPPELSGSMEEPDWISSLAIHRYAPFLATGSYDGHFRIWSDSGALVFDAGSIHDRPIKSVCWLTPEDGSSQGVEVDTLLTGGADGVIKAWSFEDLANSGNDSSDTPLRPRLIFEAREHTDEVTTLSLSSSGALFASGSLDATIKVYSTQTSADGVSEVRSNANGNKKRRVTDRVSQKPHVVELSGHSGAINAIAFKEAYLTDNSEENTAAVLQSDGTLYSVGNDHAIKVWNVEKSINNASFSAGVVPLCVSASCLSDLVATGHVDRRIRLWDPRLSQGSCKIGLAPLHKSWITGVKWSQDHEHMLASVGLDGQTKIWDIRSPRTALYNLTQPPSTALNHSPRLLSIDWAKGRVATGGENKTLYIWTIPSPAKV